MAFRISLKNVAQALMCLAGWNGPVEQVAAALRSVTWSYAGHSA